MTKTIRHVINSASIEGGHAIQIELEFADATRETLRVEFQTLPLVAEALRQAAAVAEQQQKAAPGQAIQLDVPHYATSVRCGTSTDNTQVVAKFATKAGFPVTIAMTPNLVKETIGKLSAELGNLGTQQPSRKN